MNHYCCIVSAIEPEGTGSRFTMLVARTNSRIDHPYTLEWNPLIVGTVTSRGKSIKQEGGIYAQAFLTAMCQQIEQAMRRGTFPNLDLVIPDTLVRQLMQTDMPEPIGQHPKGMIFYAFSV